MTDEEQAFNQQVAEALEAVGLGEYAWDPAPMCPQGHPYRVLLALADTQQEAD